MAPTMSEPKDSLDWRGESVTIAEVLAALTDIRRKFAQAAAGEDDHPHPRNCVMTLVAVVSAEADERKAQQVCTAIASHHPSLAIVVREQARVADHIDASISTPAAPPADYELVTLHVRGAAGEHLAGLVDPLLMSGVPTYLWWLGTPPFGSKELRDALQIADALVVDSARFERPYHSFLGLADLTVHTHRHLGLSDFQWARLAPWRETLAQFFSPMERRRFMSGISEIGIDYAGEGRGNRIAAALLVGWLASANGWKLQRAAGGAGGVVSAQYVADRWRIVDVALRSVPKARLAQGELGAVRVAGTASGITFKVSIQRDPERPRRPAPDIGPLEFRHLHRPGGEDDAGMEIAHRKAAQHREMVFQKRDVLHHTATGNAPGESMPRHPTVFVRERRGDSSLVLLTLIDIGGADTLRHVQRIEPEDDAPLLLQLLATGANDPVYKRSLEAAAELMRAL
jgi:glucose-6-phosphate dehydrogenase assembly protein OpcA